MQRKKRRNNSSKRLYVSFTAVILLFLAAYFISFSPSNPKVNVTELGDLNVTPHLYYGMDISDCDIENHKVAENEFLADIMMSHGVPYESVHKLVENTKEIFDVRNLRQGKLLNFVRRDSVTEHMIYDPSPYYYYVFDLSDQTGYRIDRPVTKTIGQAVGMINSSMWNAIIDAGLSPGIATVMEDAFAWSVDMYHVQPGDKFSLVFEEEIVNGKKVNYGKLIAGHFIASGTNHYAFLYDSGKHNGYFDLEGRSMKKAFLKSPVKYGRISSGFNRRRFHPVLKRVKAHLGTDYAAARGTPIQAVAAGTVTKASYTGGNGRYVKLRHDAVYETQYLHMSKFAKGIKPGASVTQGQTIGYVGSSGLATGPHVCFRFWKNGKQVNHLREKLPAPKPMPKERLPEYFELRDSLKQKLDLIEQKQFEMPC